MRQKGRPGCEDYSVRISFLGYRFSQGENDDNMADECSVCFHVLHRYVTQLPSRIDGAQFANEPLLRRVIND